MAVVRRRHGGGAGRAREGHRAQLHRPPCEGGEAEEEGGPPGDLRHWNPYSYPTQRGSMPPAASRPCVVWSSAIPETPEAPVPPPAGPLPDVAVQDWRALLTSGDTER